jgi:hypothetical protein
MTTAQIINFPGAQAAPEPDAPRQATLNHQPLNHELGTRGQTVGIAYVARELMLSDLSLATIVRRLKDLTEHRGFPAANLRAFNNVLLRGAGAISPRSAWTRAEVDDWIRRDRLADARALWASGTDVRQTQAHAHLNALLAQRFHPAGDAA